VGRLTLVDDDMVSPAHLESQAQATQGHRHGGAPAGHQSRGTVHP
jgi:hypothetical protein